MKFASIFSNIFSSLKILLKKKFITFQWIVIVFSPLKPNDSWRIDSGPKMVQNITQNGFGEKRFCWNKKTKLKQIKLNKRF